MTHEEHLKEMIAKLKVNREKVPIEILKTKYAEPYNKLCEGIKAELKHIALQFPPWIEGRQIKAEYGEEIEKLTEELYAAGGYSKKLGAAAFKNYDAGEAIRIAGQFTQELEAALEDYTRTKSCLYATAQCWPGLADQPQTPKIYNDLLRMFWDEAAGGWREPRPGEQEPAILIFIDKGEGKQ